MRGPDGKFIPWAGEIQAWLPVWLKHTRVEAVLDILIAYQIEREQCFVGHAKNALTDDHYQTQDVRDRASDSCLDHAQLQRRRRMVLVKALEEYKAVR